MSPISRGFRGRSVPAGEEDRVPPGQHVTTDFPVLSAGPTPQTPLPEWTFSITQGGDTLKSWTWQEMQALPAETVAADIHCVTRWSKLGTQWRGVRWTRCWTRSSTEAAMCWRSATAATPPTCRPQDVTGGQSMAGLRLRRRAARTRARRPGPAARAAPVLLEERQVGPRPGTARLRRARILGDLRLPHVWGPMETTAVRGRLTWQAAAVTSIARETASVVTIGLETARLGRTSCRAASGRPADRRGRLHAPSVPTRLPRRPASRWPSPSSGWRTARCHRTSPTNCGPETKSSCAARSAGTSCGSPPMTAR